MRCVGLTLSRAVPPEPRALKALLETQTFGLCFKGSVLLVQHYQLLSSLGFGLAEAGGTSSLQKTMLGTQHQSWMWVMTRNFQPYAGHRWHQSLLHPSQAWVAQD